MKKAFCLLLSIFALSTMVDAQPIPRQLWGKWRVHRELPTSTISCWGEKEVRAMIGTQIEFTADSLRWKKVFVNHVNAEVSVLSAQRYHDEYSGGGTNGSDITFRELGIKTTKITQVSIKHPDGKIADETTEVPGDVVLIKAKNAIVFSVCNVYFEAERIEARRAPKK